MQVKICLERGFDRLNGDLATFFSGTIGNFCMALILSSVFFNLPATTDSFFSRGALLFYAVLIAAFSSALEVNLIDTVDERRRGDLMAAFCRFWRFSSNDLLLKNIPVWHFTTPHRKPWHP
jgi:hypothetical protein